MFSMRRYTIYLALAACVLFTLNYFRTEIKVASTAIPRIGSIIPTSGPKDDGKSSVEVVVPNGPFRWKDVPTRYPVTSFAAIPTAPPQKLPKVQFDFPIEETQAAATRKVRQAAVRAVFDKCWNAYRKHAWMNDELGPLSGGQKNGFGGWGANLVDNLDNLWIMGFKDQFEDAVKVAMEIDLSTATVDTINVFETTIRHLGGFLACYDLSEDKRCLTKAVEFGEMLYKAFDTPNRMPITRWKPQLSMQAQQVADETVLVAEIGSLTMEFTRLSLLTGDPKYYDAVDRITKEFAKQQTKTKLKGMWPVVVDARKQDFTQDSLFTLGAMSDSLYEYFPKMHALLGGIDPIYERMYNLSMAGAASHNLFRPMTPKNDNILVAGKSRSHHIDDPPDLEPEGQHLVCFAGGMFALGGKLFSNPAHVFIGRQLTDGCIWAYRAMPLGIMPEVFTMLPCPKPDACDWDEKLWADAVDRIDPRHEQRLPQGFTSITDSRYILRPEAIESIFVLYRITGDRGLLDTAWEMFQSITNVTTTPLANAALTDVTWSREELNKGRGIQMDSMESFWMAETLKYFWLIFGEVDVLSLDEWVFNTEAHPLKRRLPAEQGKLIV
ncbi:hypothetical protein B0A48_15425 [Cryoendolithus antarcticus]|uniref:alpha-1,2-Mannosidase n=1 Tax=Cryoendolithus antarcticus TaxID=1507870 RepID=A0A1V8SI53_9PEZI|nr:hypothetical protein B0A48_15425 [Cryoendolithus antarcticus]